MLLSAFSAMLISWILIGKIPIFPQPNCFEAAAKQKKLVVAIAKLKSSDRSWDEYLSDVKKNTEEKLTRHITPEIRDHITICSIEDSVSSENEAKSLGNKLKAAIIIWGRQNQVFIDIQVTTLKINVGYLNSLPISMNDVQNLEKSQDLPNIIALMATHALSTIYYRKEKQNSVARKVLEYSLNYIDKTKPKLSNDYVREKLATAKWRLASLYIPITKDNLNLNDCPKYIQDCTKAAKLFHESRDLDSSSPQVFIDEGNIQIILGNYVEAEKAYSDLIQINPESQGGLIARVNRAMIYSEQHNFQKAIEDFKFVSQRKPNDYESLNYLGNAQLQAGDIQAAKRTYQQVKNSLGKNEAARNKIISSLNNIARARPQLQQEIQSIIYLLE